VLLVISLIAGCYRVLYNHDFYIIQITVITAKSAAEPAA